MVNVGSSLGSLGRVTTEGLPESEIPAMAYGSSKAAVNMITVHYAKAFPRMRINCVDPGYTATDLNGNSGFQTTAEAAAIIADGLCRAGRPDVPRRPRPPALVTGQRTAQNDAGSRQFGDPFAIDFLRGCRGAD